MIKFIPRGPRGAPRLGNGLCENS